MLYPGSEVGQVHNGQDGEGPALLKRPRESDRKEIFERDFVFMWSSGCALVLQ